MTADNYYKITETNNWIVSHRQDSQYLGYLIVSSKDSATNISELHCASLMELGKVLSEVEKLLLEVYSPIKVIVAKLGFSKGFPCHFHIIPVFNNLLREIVVHKNYTNSAPDGNDVLLFVSREYCEQPLSSKNKKAIMKTVAILREKHCQQENREKTE